MTTNQTNIPEPTALNSVAVGKRGETVVAVHADDEEATMRHCPWCASIWIQRKDRA